MDYDKYYIQRGDFYSVHFINRDGRSEDEIRDIFSEYGNVLSVKLPSGIYGFCFVKYKSLDETVACLKGLQNHESIRILKERSKLNPSESKDGNVKEGRYSYQKNFDQKDRYQNTNRQSRNWERRSPDRNSNEDRSGDRKFNNFNRESKDWNRQESNNVSGREENRRAAPRDSWSDTSSTHSSTNAKPNDSSTNVDKKQAANVSQLLKLRKLRGINSDTFSLQGEKEATRKLNEEIDNDRTPVQAHEDNFANFSPISHSSNKAVDNSESPTMNSAEKIVRASEVIVTNVHPNYGIHYILHLFERFSPIAATLMKTISGTSIKYCHVYFEKEANAIAVENMFNNYLLENQKLIVMQPKDLVQTVAK